MARYGRCGGARCGEVWSGRYGAVRFGEVGRGLVWHGEAGCGADGGDGFSDPPPFFFALSKSPEIRVFS
jgi:hypothetical protein